MKTKRDRRMRLMGVTGEALFTFGQSSAWNAIRGCGCLRIACRRFDCCCNMLASNS